METTIAHKEITFNGVPTLEIDDGPNGIVYFQRMGDTVHVKWGYARYLQGTELRGVAHIGEFDKTPLYAPLRTWVRAPFQTSN